MALITVTGTITRMFFENKGVEVTEFYTSKDGEQRKRRYTAWFETPQDIVIGDTGTFTGLLSATIDNWTNPDGTPKLDLQGKPGQSVKVSINGASYTAEYTAPKTAANAGTTQLITDEYPF